ncbi:MAG: amidohydrolase [Treponema sp.]|nr:amidohydrolase [Treponema sp.]
MLFVKNGKVMTMEGQTLDGASIIVKDGKIAEIGSGLAAPTGAKVVDAQGMLVLPGFVDAHTHLGVAGTAMRWEGDDVNEHTDPVTPHMRTLDAINPLDESFAETMRSGVTAVATSPGSANIIGGQIAAIKTAGSIRADDLIIKFPLAMKCALGENPKNAFGQSKKAQPMTRMGSAAIFREAFYKAKEYLRKKETAEPDKTPEYNAKHEALIPVLKKEIPIHIHAHRADDIHTALRLAKEFDINAVLIHCSSGHLISGDIADAGFPAVIGPTFGFRTKPETYHKTFETVNVLNKAGILTCITTDHPVIPLEHLNICAALAVQAGLSEEEALKSITIYAAKVMGLEDRIGSIKAGKDADIVLWDKSPLDPTSRARTVIIDGKIVYEHGGEK